MKEIDYDKYYWQNETVRLREMRSSDWEDSYRNQFDSVARRQLQYEMELPPGEDRTRASVETFCGFKPESGRLMFVAETLGGEPVGALNLNSTDEKNGTFSIGIQIDRDHRGKGYGTSAMRILLRYAFYERRLNKLNNSVIEGNTASMRMFEKLGAKVEGVRRQTVFMDGRYWDETLVGITRADFEEAH